MCMTEGIIATFLSYFTIKMMQTYIANTFLMGTFYER